MRGLIVINKTAKRPRLARIVSVVYRGADSIATIEYTDTKERASAVLVRDLVVIDETKHAARNEQQQMRDRLAAEKKTSKPRRKS
jgi:hypothetical protein